MNIDKIWQDYGQGLKAFLASRIKEPAEVDDLLQDILLKSHRHLGALRSRDKLKPWLFQLASNAISDYYRQRQRRTLPSAEELWYTTDDSELQQQLARCIIPFIETLPEDIAAALLAVEIEGQSQKDYAARTGLNYSTLKSRIQRGRGQLRRLFEACCHLELDHRGNIVACQSKSSGCNTC